MEEKLNMYKKEISLMKNEFEILKRKYFREKMVKSSEESIEQE